jgi:hypothetical protein
MTPEILVNFGEETRRPTLLTLSKTVDDERKDEVNVNDEAVSALAAGAHGGPLIRPPLMFCSCSWYFRCGMLLLHFCYRLSIALLIPYLCIWCIFHINTFPLILFPLSGLGMKKRLRRLAHVRLHALHLQLQVAKLLPRLSELQL